MTKKELLEFLKAERSGYEFFRENNNLNIPFLLV